jgi:hypothetical protein
MFLSGSKVFKEAQVMFEILNMPKTPKSIATAKNTYMG